LFGEICDKPKTSNLRQVLLNIQSKLTIPYIHSFTINNITMFQAKKDKEVEAHVPAEEIAPTIL
jgi:hypothetical protein